MEWKDLELTVRCVTKADLGCVRRKEQTVLNSSRGLCEPCEPVELFRFLRASLIENLAHLESISVETPTILGDAESMDAVISEVRKGLMSKRKSLAPWLFYDDAGSALFEEITAFQRLFEHGRLQARQSVLAHGAAGAIGSMVTQLAREAGAYVIGTGRAADRQAVFDFGAKEFVADEHRRRLDPRRCRRRLQPDRATQGEDDHPRSPGEDSGIAQRTLRILSIVSRMVS
jgi:hypothetical protein